MRKKLLRFQKRYHISRRKHIRRFRLFSRHPFMVPVATVLILGVLTALGFVVFGHHAKVAADAQVVIISHDHTQQIVPSRERTVGALLKKLDITLNQGDVVEPAAATPIDQDQFRINIYRAVPVEVVDNGNPTYTYSAATTSRSIARQAGLTTYAEDAVSMAPVDNFVQQKALGEQVVIKRATPVNMNLYGTPLAIRTQAKTVGDLVKEKSITLAKDDQIMPSADTPISNNQQIFIVRNGTKLETDTQTIPMPVQTIQDPSLAYGTSAVRQQGSAGQQAVTYQVNLQNGKEVSRSVIQTVITTQPVTQIAVIGTSLSGIRGDMALAGISAADYSAADYIISNESGWCPTKWQGEYGGCPAYHGTPGDGVGYGLCQATPGYKMASAGEDWATNPITQLGWCSTYALRTYGGWQAAQAHWESHHNW